MPNTAMDGCSGFSPDHHTASISNIQLVCGPWPSGQSVQKGESTRRRSQQKSCSNPILGRCSRFSATKNHRFRTCRPLCFYLIWAVLLTCVSPILYSLLRTNPMTDFRQVWCLHAYSGGTVRDSHPVFYSLVVLLPHPQALKRNIYLRKQYTRYCTKCQSKRKVHRSSFTLLFFSWWLM